MYISAQSPQTPGSNLLGITPQIQSNAMLNDNTSWVKISGCFQAAGGEKFVTIGNFKVMDPSDNSTPIGGGGNAQQAYYYIDDIGLYEFPTAGPAKTIVCGTRVTLGEGFLPSGSDVTYSWSPAAGLDNPNILNPVAAPTSTTTYTLTITSPGCSASVSSVTVTVTPAVAYGGGSLIICQGRPYQLTGFSPSGGTWSGPNVTAAGLFTPDIDGIAMDFILTYTVNNSCGTSTDTIKIRVEPVIPVTVQTYPSVCATSAPFNLFPPIGGSGTWYGPGITDAINGTFDPSVAYHGPVRIFYYPSWNTDNCETYAFDMNVLPPSCCPGYFSNNPAIPAELGDPNVLTTLSGNLDFDGSYHVTGVLKLENGTFTLQPGTKFYFEGEGVDPSVYNHIWTLGDGRTSLLLENATLVMDDSVTLTSPCNNMWGGIVLLGNSIIKSNSSKIPSPSPSGISYNEISHAMEPIKTYDPSNGTAPYIQNELYMRYTNFSNNMNGIEFRSNLQQNEGIFNCHFTSVNSQMKPPAYKVSGFVGADISVNNPGSRAMLVQYCTFDNLSYALLVNGKNFQIANNTFTNIYHHSIHSIAGQNIEIKDNHFTITSKQPSLSGGDFSHSYNFTVGPTAIMLWGDASGLIQGNTFEGDNANPATGRFKTGIQSPFRYFDRITIQNNQFRDLNEGIRGLAWGAYQLVAGGPYLPATVVTISDNLFENNLEAIVFDAAYTAPAGSSPFMAEAILTCNTFDVAGLTSQPARALWVKSGVHMNDLGSALAPNGNRFKDFKSTDEILRNDGVNTGLSYYRYHDSNTDEVFGSLQTPNVAILNSDPFQTTISGSHCFGLNNGATNRLANNSSSQNELLTEASLTCYPNPAGYETTIVYTLPSKIKNSEVRINSLADGKQVARFATKAEGKLKVNTQNLAAGIYVCTLVSDGVLIKTIKLVVIR